MPVNDGPQVDERTVLVQWWVSWAKDEYHPYGQIEADRQAAVAEEEAKAAAKVALSERMRALARRPRSHLTPTGKRAYSSRNARKPWLAAGYPIKAQWLADGSPGPMTLNVEE